MSDFTWWCERHSAAQGNGVKPLRLCDYARHRVELRQAKGETLTGKYPTPCKPSERVLLSAWDASALRGMVAALTREDNDAVA
jgi:hypothetical protein